MNRRMILLLMCLCVTHSPLRAASPEDIATSLTRAKHFLYSYQHADGGWEGAAPVRDAQGNFAEPIYGPQYGGTTALVIFSLLAAGESAQSDKLAKAIDFLTRIDTPGTYGVGIRCLVWNLLPRNKTYIELLNRDSQILLKNMKAKGDERGMYHYNAGTDSAYDHSVSQFGALGEWACADAGVEVPEQFWAEVDRAWRAHQYEDGSWSYVYARPGSGLSPILLTTGPSNGAPSYYASTVSMTAAGVATLFLSHEMGNPNQVLEGDTYDRDIDRGVAWLSQHFDDVFDSNKQMAGAVEQYYTLFGISRIAFAGGYKYLGDVDWFQRGGDYLRKTQGADGSWNGYGGPFANTAFGVLFLSRGGSPVMMSKLRYDLTDSGGQTIAGDWNMHPRDAANLAKWVGKEIEQHLNWQIVDLKAPFDETPDSRILYISGDQALKFPPDALTRLRSFVESGGLILGNASGNSSAFSTSFLKLGRKLFPAYEFRELPANHPIYSDQMFPRSKWLSKPRLVGLSNGVRELMLLVPQVDVARSWRIAAAKPDLLELGGDIFLYTTDQEDFQIRGTSYLVKPDPTKPVKGREQLALIQYDGNWNPEPGAWRRLQAILHNDYQLDLDVRPVLLGSKSLQTFKVAHLTGTGPLRFTDTQGAELKTFVAGGGLLVVDAAGGSPQFAASAATSLESIFGQHMADLAPLASNSPLLSTSGHPLGKVSYRRAAKAILGALDTPRIKVMIIAGRPRVLFSAEDLTAGLVGPPVDGIVGYTPQSATTIMCNIVSSAALQSSSQTH